MEIEFFNKETGNICKFTDDCMFVMNNEVYKDTYETCESQEAMVGFEDFIEKCPDLGWRVVSK